MSEEPPRAGRLFGAAIDEAFQDHVLHVGQVAYYWNDLHENLGKLFVVAVQTEENLGMAAWHSLQSDRAQRDMLRDVLAASPADRWPHFPCALPNAKWVVAKTNSLSDKRNDALHSPFEMHMRLGWRDGASPITVSPAVSSGHPRALRLQGKDLVAEFEFYASTAQTLSEFTRSMVAALTFEGHSWPEKPRLPSLGQKTPPAK